MASFRLRPGKDDDIIAGLNSIPSWKDKSDVFRDALRLYFSHGEGKTQKTNTFASAELKPAEITQGVEERLDGLINSI